MWPRCWRRTSQVALGGRGSRGACESPTSADEEAAARRVPKLGNPPVRRSRSGSAKASGTSAMRRIAGEPARARVRGGNESEPGREHDRLHHPRDDHAPVLERLTQTFDRVARNSVNSSRNRTPWCDKVRQCRLRLSEAEAVRIPRFLNADLNGGDESCASSTSTRTSNAGSYTRRVAVGCGDPRTPTSRDSLGRTVYMVGSAKSTS